MASTLFPFVGEISSVDVSRRKRERLFHVAEKPKSSKSAPKASPSPCVVLSLNSNANSVINIVESTWGQGKRFNHTGGSYKTQLLLTDEMGHDHFRPLK